MWSELSEGVVKSSDNIATGASRASRRAARYARSFRPKARNPKSPNLNHLQAQLDGVPLNSVSRTTRSVGSLGKKPFKTSVFTPLIATGVVASVIAPVGLMVIANTKNRH